MQFKCNWQGTLSRLLIKILLYLTELLLEMRNWVFLIRPAIRKSIDNLETPPSPRHRFQCADEVKSASQAELKDIGWKSDGKCLVAQGSHFEGGCVSAI
ncbi:hypothetical protein TNCV_4384891 [Trichonephila clavipes]|nr:hypothetical protein TNCV_4384891 [Trichonephila clavipes]